MLDKRGFPRLSEIWDLDYTTISARELKKNPYSTYTMNVSGGGICFEADEEIPKGTMLALELKSKIFPSPIIALAETIWCKKKGEEVKYDVGVEFWWTGWKDSDAQKSLAEYISKKIPSKD